MTRTITSNWISGRPGFSSLNVFVSPMPPVSYPSPARGDTSPNTQQRSVRGWGGVRRGGGQSRDRRDTRVNLGCDVS